MSVDVNPVALPAFAAFHWDAGFECWEHVTTVNADDVGVIWAVDSAVAQSAIDALTARIAELEREAVELRKDAGRYRWLWDQHEGIVLNGLDADGVMLPATVREIGFSVFMPDKWGHEALVPVPIGDLDETIDAAIAAKEQP